jgi:UDP-glucose 4-epimerase
VADVVRANLAAAGRRGFAVYNVGTGRETSVVELYRLLAGAAGVELEPRFAPAKPGEQRRSVVDASRLAAELGVGELTELADGLRATAEWFRAAREANAGR